MNRIYGQSSRIFLSRTYIIPIELNYGSLSEFAFVDTYKNSKYIAI